MRRETELPEKKRKKRKIVRIRRKRKTEDVSVKGKRKKSKRRGWVVFLFLAVCAVIIFAAFAVLKAPFFSIRSVECEGHKNLTKEQIMTISKIQVGANIFATNIDAAEKRLEGYPEITEAKIKRVFPNRLKISISEAVVVAYAEHESQFLLLDARGQIIKVHPRDAVDAVQGLAKIEGISIVAKKPGEQISAKDDARAGELFKCIGILQKLGMIEKINYINFEDLSDLHLEYEERLYILMGSYDNLEYKLKFVKKVIDESISKFERALLDFRGEKLYVRPRDEQPVEPPVETEAGAEGETQEGETAETPEGGDETQEGAPEPTQSEETVTPNTEGQQ